MAARPDFNLIWALSELTHDIQIKIPNTVEKIKTSGLQFVNPESGWSIDLESFGGFPWYRNGSNTSSSLNNFLWYVKMRSGERTALVFVTLFTNYNQLEFPVDSPLIKSGRIHPTFAKILDMYHQNVIRTIEDHKSEITDVVFSGYSHSSCNAEALFLHLREGNLFSDLDLHCVSFVSPKLGDAGVAKALTAEPNYWNIVPDSRISEMSPTMPTAMFGYSQTGKNIVWPTGQMCAGFSTITTEGDMYLVYVCYLFLCLIMAGILVLYYIIIFSRRKYSTGTFGDKPELRWAFLSIAVVLPASVWAFFFYDGYYPYVKYHNRKGPGTLAYDIYRSFDDGSMQINEYTETCKPRHSALDILSYCSAALLIFVALFAFFGRWEGGKPLSIYCYLMGLAMTAMFPVYLFAPSEELDT